MQWKNRTILLHAPHHTNYKNHARLFVLNYWWLLLRSCAVDQSVELQALHIIVDVIGANHSIGSGQWKDVRLIHRVLQNL